MFKYTVNQNHGTSRPTGPTIQWLPGLFAHEMDKENVWDKQSEF